MALPLSRESGPLSIPLSRTPGFRKTMVVEKRIQMELKDERIVKNISVSGDESDLRHYLVRLERGDQLDTPTRR